MVISRHFQKKKKICVFLMHAILINFIFFLDFLDGFMTNAETTNQLELEDYARSIIQPGNK